MNQSVPISKPRKIVVPLAEGLAWRGGGGFRYEEKMDGRFHIREVGASVVAGELMKDGRFFAFDCLAIDGQDIRRAPLRDRLECLNRFSFLRPATGCGSEFLEAALSRGAEGVVAKHLDAPYGEMFACKRIWEGLCAVTGFCGGVQSVTIADAATGQPRGKVALFGGKCDRVRIGSILKCVGMNLTARGSIREPRVCTDTPESWLVKF